MIRHLRIRRNDFRILIKKLQCNNMITIRDINGKIIKGCFTFDCGKFEISCSTIPDTSEILIFTKCGAWVITKNSISDAIDWCKENS
jgi:hypothetical protein